MIRKTLIAAVLAVLSASAMAAVSPDEAAQLGKTLTPIGAEKAGNKDGTIPEWTGGLTTPPAGFKPGDGMRPDPYASDKPRLVITGQNADQYKGQLTAITYALLKRYPTMRVDVYPTRRPVNYPKKVLDNTLKNATQARTTDGGLGFENALPGVPFPIPKTGNEAIWNHLMRYNGISSVCKYDSYNIDRSGTATLSSTGNSYQEWPLYRPENIDKVVKPTDVFWYVKQEYTCGTTSTRWPSSARHGSTCRASAASSLPRTCPTTRPTRAWRAPRPTTTRSSTTARWTAMTTSWSARRK
jgi:Protein of unknown function (DUF1329)